MRGKSSSRPHARTVPAAIPAISTSAALTVAPRRTLA
ncbi:Uncharacterised protein [Mycobacteroides abscessus subsp. abscessus]|nr:Uncharacterised protein [Mycobacteroides abscessus subsp. abscessus]SKU27330.1 Uncharacterised protein [Mycobacteroides abscessus subsp. abscessus]